MMALLVLKFVFYFNSSECNSIPFIKYHITTQQPPLNPHMLSMSDLIGHHDSIWFYSHH